VTAVRDAKPPAALVAVMNPVLRTVLRTPLGRLVRPFALLEFEGRRSGRRYRVPVGWHDVDGAPAVFTPAPWRANFAGGGVPVVVRHRGRTLRLVASLDDDPASVAASMRAMAEHGTSLRRIGVVVEPGHTIEPADALAVDRAVLRFSLP
jgi:hypothetical protein